MTRHCQTLEQRAMVRNTFRLWVACRKVSHPERICEGNQLGAQKVEDPSSPWFGHVPLPPVIMAQMQCIMYETLLRPLAKTVLDNLSTLVFSRNRKNWMTIYLIIFLLLHSGTMMTRRNEEFARQINLPVCKPVFLPHVSTLFN